MPSQSNRVLNLTQLRYSNMRQRPCRITVEMLAEAPDPNASLQQFYESLPRAGCVDEIVEAANCIVHAALAEKGIFWMVDAPAIEMGLSPLIVKMIVRRLAHSISMTGAAAMRDFELAAYGKTAESVEDGLKDGMLGLGRETGETMNMIINEGVRRGFSLGDCLSRGIRDNAPRHVGESVLAACAHYNVPASVHLSVGGDGFQFHPLADAATLGKGAMKDLHNLSARIEDLNEGGVLVCVHNNSAMTESFYRALTLARNVNQSVERFSVIHIGSTDEDLSATPGVESSYRIPGPVEIMLPLFSGVLFSLVQ